MSVSNILVSTFPPFSSLAFDAPGETPISELPALLAARFPHVPFHLPSLVLSLPSGPIHLDGRTISSLHDDDEGLVTLRLTPSILGGKGGFGSQLRAAGGRMSSQKTSNNDSCRDLNGRRLSTVKEAAKFVHSIA